MILWVYNRIHGYVCMYVCMHKCMDIHILKFAYDVRPGACIMELWPCMNVRIASDISWRRVLCISVGMDLRLYVPKKFDAITIYNIWRHIRSIHYGDLAMYECTYDCRNLMKACFMHFGMDVCMPVCIF